MQLDVEIDEAPKLQSLKRSVFNSVACAERGRDGRRSIFSLFVHVGIFFIYLVKPFLGFLYAKM